MTTLWFPLAHAASKLNTTVAYLERLCEEGKVAHKVVTDSCFARASRVVVSNVEIDRILAARKEEYARVVESVQTRRCGHHATVLEMATHPDGRTQLWCRDCFPECFPLRPSLRDRLERYVENISVESGAWHVSDEEYAREEKRREIVSDLRAILAEP